MPNWRVSERWSRRPLYKSSLVDSAERPEGNIITRRYNAGGSGPLHPTFSDDSKILKLQAVLVDEVDFVGRPLWKEDPSIEKARAQNRKRRDEKWNKYQIEASDFVAEDAACTEKDRTGRLASRMASEPDGAIVASCINWPSGISGHHAFIATMTSLNSLNMHLPGRTSTRHTCEPSVLILTCALL